jgi:hypothetical protein
MNDQSVVLVMTPGIGAHLTNDEKRAHLTDWKRAHLSTRSAFCPLKEIRIPPNAVAYCNFHLKCHRP